MTEFCAPENEAEAAIRQYATSVRQALLDICGVGPGILRQMSRIREISGLDQDQVQQLQMHLLYIRDMPPEDIQIEPGIYPEGGWFVFIAFPATEAQQEANRAAITATITEDGLIFDFPNDITICVPPEPLTPKNTLAFAQQLAFGTITEITMRRLRDANDRQLLRFTSTNGGTQWYIRLERGIDILGLTTEVYVRAAGQAPSYDSEKLWQIQLKKKKPKMK